MINMKFLLFMKQEYNPGEELHQMYVLKGEGCVLYVGISTVDPWWRWFNSPSPHLYLVSKNKLRAGSQVGEAVVRCLPESMDWTIELWTVEDCISFLNITDRFQTNRLNRHIRYAENLMIKKLNPVLNIAGGHFRYDALPERIRRYMEADEEKMFEAYRRLFDDG